MTSSRCSVPALVLALALVTGCSAGENLGVPAVSPPESITVTALSIRSVKVEWAEVAPTSNETIGYRLERRVGLTGDFTPLPPTLVPLPRDGQVTLFDTDVVADTYYGYRVRAVNTLGETSEYSVVRGARTPPPPGIEVRTLSAVNSAIADQDGYTIELTGPGAGATPAVAAIGINDVRHFSPLAVGEYQVALRGVAPLCTVQGEPVRSATVDDASLNTVDTVQYTVDCRDPTRGTIRVIVTVAGGGVDADGFTARLEGIVTDGPPMDVSRPIGGAGGNELFSGLLPGDYQVTLQGIADNCAVPNVTVEDLELSALEDLEVTFAVTCSRDVNNPDEGYELKGEWASIAAGQMTYTLTIDMSTFNDPAINGDGPDDIFVISGTTFYDSEKLTLLGSENVDAVTGMANQGSNETSLGSIAWQNFDTQSGQLTGRQGVIRFIFEKKAGAAGTVSPRTEFGALDDVQSENGTDLRPRLIRLDSDLDLDDAGGAGPTADANGPYTGTAGQPVLFNSTGSAAGSGRTIVSYSWSFSDATTATGPSPSKTFASAGGYTATLTVTDDQGDTDSDAATVTIGGGGGQLKYILIGSWGPVAGGQVTYTLTYDLTGLDDPAIPGPDDVFVISGTTTFDATRLDFVGSANVSGSLLQNQGSNETTPGSVAWQNFDTDPARATGAVGVIRLTFNVLAGATGTVTPVTTFGALDDLQSENGTNLKAGTILQESGLTLGGGGGTSPPTAEANGPYNGTAGQPVAFNSTGSIAAAGRTITGYGWSFSDGTNASGASPSKSFAAAGSYTAILTVTDNAGESDTDQASVTIAPAASATPLTWRNVFGPVDGDGTVTLTVTLDLTPDLPETSGPEALGSFVLDSIRWNPTLLQFLGYALPAGNVYSPVLTSSAAGWISIPSGIVASPNSTGLVTILTLRFRPVGAGGSAAGTTTFLKTLTGTTATGGFAYRPKTQIVEGTFTLP